MESIKSFFTKLTGQFGDFWNNLSTPKKAGVAAVVIVVIAGLSSLLLLNKGSEYEYLFIDLSPEDTHAITAYLKKSGLTDYVIDSKGVRVPEEHVAHYRIKLSQEGLPTNGQVGWEKFDDPDFTRTEFERKIQKIRAIQGELARTITAIDNISSARVHIVNPEQRLFQEDQQEPTAAVYIKTKRGSTLSRRQISGIVHLVAKSVEGLKTDNITIIDFEGRLLTDEQSKDPNTKQQKEMLEFKRNYEKRLEEKVRAIVGRIVGQDKVEAKVDATIDFTKEEQTISDLDPDKVVVVSQNTTSQNVNGTGLNPTGIPGSKSNVPGEQEQLNLSTSSAENSRESELLNYEIAKTISHRVLPSAKIKRISAAVIVDGKQLNLADGSTPPFEPRSEEEMAKIEELVKSAIGYVEKRDEVKVHNLPFTLDYVQVEALQAERQEKREYISTLAVASVIALALVLFFAFIVRPYFRWLSYDPERKEKESIVEEYKPDLELGSIQNVHVKEDVPFDKLSPQEQVMYLAKHEPVRTTEAIRMLLNPHSTST